MFSRGVVAVSEQVAVTPLELKYMWYKIEVYENMLDCQPLATKLCADELAAEAAIRTLKEKAERILAIKGE